MFSHFWCQLMRHHDPCKVVCGDLHGLQNFNHFVILKYNIIIQFFKLLTYHGYLTTINFFLFCFYFHYYFEPAF